MTIFLKPKTKYKAGIATYFSDSFVVAAVFSSFLIGSESAQTACLMDLAGRGGSCQDFEYLTQRGVR